MNKLNYKFKFFGDKYAAVDSRADTLRRMLSWRNDPAISVIKVSLHSFVIRSDSAVALVCRADEDSLMIGL